jgi:hypothetical protein
MEEPSATLAQSPPRKPFKVSGLFAPNECELVSSTKGPPFDVQEFVKQIQQH